MFKESYDINNYINFLFYGIDSKTDFIRSDFITAYRNKYERLSNTLPGNNTQTITSAYLLIIKFIDMLKDKIPGFLNKERIVEFKNCFNSSEYDKLIFNNIISLSFIELQTDDEDKWSDIKFQVDYFCNEYCHLIHDDSKDHYKILSIDVPITEYRYQNNCIDVTDYNASIIGSFYDIYRTLPCVDISIKNIFTSELKYLINTNSINRDTLFTELLNKCMSIDMKDLSLFEIQNICKEIMSYMNSNNLYLIVHLQYNMLEKVFNENKYFDSEFENGIMIRILTTIIAIDIWVYNNSFKCDEEELRLLLLAYNYCIIRLQDMIDKISNDLSCKKIAMFMYKSQLFKSRNKLQERMSINA